MPRVPTHEGVLLGWKDEDGRGFGFSELYCGAHMMLIWTVDFESHHVQWYIIRFKFYMSWSHHQIEIEQSLFGLGSKLHMYGIPGTLRGAHKRIIQTVDLESHPIQRYVLLFYFNRSGSHHQILLNHVSIMWDPLLLNWNWWIYIYH